MKKDDVFAFTAPDGVRRKAIVLTSVVRFDANFPEAAEVLYLCYTVDKQLLFIKCMETDWAAYPSSKYMDDEYNPADGLILDDSDIAIIATNVAMPFEYIDMLGRYDL
jgi:hypothetical protein